MQTETTDPGRSFAERILGELRTMRFDLDLLTKEVGILNECAMLALSKPDGETESPLQATMRLLRLLVEGTGETHRRLETMTATLFDGRMNAALRASMEL